MKSRSTLTLTLTHKLTLKWQYVKHIQKHYIQSSEIDESHVGYHRRRKTVAYRRGFRRGQNPHWQPQVFFERLFCAFAVLAWWNVLSQLLFQLASKKQSFFRVALHITSWCGKSLECSRRCHPVLLKYRKIAERPGSASDTPGELTALPQIQNPTPLSALWASQRSPLGLAELPPR